MAVLTPGKLGTHWLRQFRAYTEAADPLGVKYVLGAYKGRSVETYGKPHVLTRRKKSNLGCSSNLLEPIWLIETPHIGDHFTSLGMHIIAPIQNNPKYHDESANPS